MYENVQVRIARIFNTYGPRMCIDDGRVVSNFVAQVKYVGRCRGISCMQESEFYWLPDVIFVVFFRL